MFCFFCFWRNPDHLFGRSINERVYRKRFRASGFFDCGAWVDLYPLFILPYVVCMIVNTGLYPRPCDEYWWWWWWWYWMDLFEFVSLICVMQLTAGRLFFLPNFGDNSGLAGDELAELTSRLVNGIIFRVCVCLDQRSECSYGFVQSC